MTIKEILEKYEIKDLKELDEILDDYTEALCSFIIAVNFIESKNLHSEFKQYIKEHPIP